MEDIVKIKGQNYIKKLYHIISCEDIKDTSKLWINNSEKMFSDRKVYYISPDIIFDNLYYEWHKGGKTEVLNKTNVSPYENITFGITMPKLVHQYKIIYEDLKKNGWDNKYPARIGIGNRGEVFLNDGNNRINLIKDINLDYIPIMFIYVNNHVPTNKSVLLEDGRDFYPYGLLPKWTTEKEKI